MMTVFLEVKIGFKNSKYQWDKYIIDEFNKYDDRLVFIYGKDGIWNGKKTSITGWKSEYLLATAGFIHKNWIKVSGYFLPPYFSSDYNDTWLSEVFSRANRIVFTDKVYIEHMHYTMGKMEIDQNTLDRLKRHKNENINNLYKDLQSKRDKDVEKILNIII